MCCWHHTYVCEHIRESIHGIQDCSRGNSVKTVNLWWTCLVWSLLSHLQPQFTPSQPEATCEVVAGCFFPPFSYNSSSELSQILWQYVSVMNPSFIDGAPFTSLSSLYSQSPSLWPHAIKTVVYNRWQSGWYLGEVLWPSPPPHKWVQLVNKLS